MIVDSSAIMAILLGEPDAPAYAAALEEAVEIRISAATFVEAFAVADAANMGDELERLLEAVRAKTEPFTARQAGIARAAYRRYGRGSGHPARLNFGDCFAYALSADLGEPLLFKGNDFSQTDVHSAM